LYGATIIATTTLGTTMVDFADRSFGVGYPRGVAIVFALLLSSLAMWYRSKEAYLFKASSHPGAEWLYLITILLFAELGTALGDWVAGSDRAGLGLGYEYGALIFRARLIVVAAPLSGREFAHHAVLSSIHPDATLYR
jgi:uncharacterized membrane-anchored protein